MVDPRPPKRDMHIFPTHRARELQQLVGQSHWVACTLACKKFLSILDRYEKHITSKIYVKRVNSKSEMGMLFQDDEWRRPGARQGKIT